MEDDYDELSTEELDSKWDQDTEEQLEFDFGDEDEDS